ncbi:MAG: tRNA uracil 4-sulfurtransferase ThiI [Thermodesulfobacteriota bacterium]
MRCVLIRYHEIALKGKNRPAFIHKLKDNLILAAQGLGVSKAEVLMGRIMLSLDENASWPRLKEALSRVPGVANYSLAFKTDLNLEELKRQVKIKLTDVKFDSFRVRASRAYKDFPLTSPEIDREVGAFIKEFSKARVDLKKADLTVFIEILPKMAFFYFQKEPGPGGLPVGISGKVVGLMSGGIDSPVAAYRMIKRGCRVVFVHFHAYPFLDNTSQKKARELVEILNRYQYSSRLYLVPLGEPQRQVSVQVRAPYRVVVYRRLMVRIGEAIARREGAQGLVTGDSLGQVASQTLENLTVIEEAASLPLIRPLIGMDKQEIIGEAQMIGTYSTSIIPDQDCCQLFVPKNVATYTSVEEITEAEKALDIDKLIAMALEGTKLVRIGPGGERLSSPRVAESS